MAHFCQGQFTCGDRSLKIVGVAWTLRRSVLCAWSFTGVQACRQAPSAATRAWPALTTLAKPEAGPSEGLPAQPTLPTHAQTIWRLPPCCTRTDCKTLAGRPAPCGHKSMIWLCNRVLLTLPEAPSSTTTGAQTWHLGKRHLKSKILGANQGYGVACVKGAVMQAIQ